MHTRRQFVQRVAASLCLPSAVLGGADGAASSILAERPPQQPTGSDVGSLFPFIQSQAVRGEFPLSYLRPQFKSLAAWKRRARGKLLELLQYAPPKCAPRAEVVERKDCGDYFREKVYFNTTPDLRVPAYVLLPKSTKFPAPALVALHDHGAFYFWGKEKLIEMEDEHPALAKFKRQYYAGASIASTLA